MARLDAKWNNFSERGQTWDHFWQDAATASSGTAYTLSLSDTVTLSDALAKGGSGGGSQPAPIISVTLQPDEDMKRREVRAFIQSGIETLTETAQFNSGKIDEFNSQPDKGYPFCWLDSLKVKSELTTTYLPVDDWDISILIVKQDSLGSAPEEYEEIIDHCDELAQQLIYQINNQVSGYKLVTIKGISRDPFIKKLADCTTGVNLSFTLTAPDLTNNC